MIEVYRKDLVQMSPAERDRTLNQMVRVATGQAETQASAPDLARLGRETRIRVEVAKIAEAAEWRASDMVAGKWELVGTRDGTDRALAILRENGEPYFHPHRLPDYLHDPAAWGALEDAEKVEVMYGIDCVYARCEGRPMPEWSTGETRPAAVAAAVLAKHGKAVEL